MPGSECCVVTNDLDELGSDVRSEELGGDLTVAGVAEDLADVVAQRGQDELVIGSRPQRSCGHLERVVELADLSTVGHVGQAQQATPDAVRSSALAVEPFHGVILGSASAPPSSWIREKLVSGCGAHRLRRDAAAGTGSGFRMRLTSAPWKVGWLAPLTVAAVLWSPGPGAAAGAAGARNSSAVASEEAGISGWKQVGSSVENTLGAGEGVATVQERGQRAGELYRGIQSVPPNLSAQGWTHIGDPDSLDGSVFDAYQGPSSGNSKMFLVTTPAGKSLEYVHTLVPGELYNNSFDAISPDGQWMIAGEWGTMRHLQIYPTPWLNHATSPDGGSLRLAGYIKLDHKVNDIQGCDFVTPVRLICASDDDSRTLFPNEKPLLEVTLPTSLHGTSVSGHVVDLGAIPQQSSCSGTFEAEGVDFDVATGILRVEIIQPAACILKTTVFEYKQVGHHR